MYIYSDAGAQILRVPVCTFSLTLLSVCRTDVNFTIQSGCPIVQSLLRCMHSFIIVEFSKQMVLESVYKYIVCLEKVFDWLHNSQ